MKKALFTTILFTSVFSMASVKAEYLYNKLQVKEQELTRIKCKKVFAGLTCVRVTDEISTSPQYYCTIELTKNDSIRI